MRLCCNLCLQGERPTFDETLELFQLLTESRDLRQPVQLEQQLWDDHTLDDNVTRAMLQMLQVGPHIRAFVLMSWPATVI